MTVPVITMKRILFFLFLITIFACGDGDYGVDRVFIDNLHYHTIDIGHGHSFEVLEHTHTDKEIIEALIEKQVSVETEAPEISVPEVVSVNPFSDIIVASQTILAMDGGTDLLNIAMGKGSTDQKLRNILQMRDSEAKRLLIEAYAEHNAWISSLLTQLGIESVDNKDAETSIASNATRARKHAIMMIMIA